MADHTADAVLLRRLGLLFPARFGAPDGTWSAENELDLVELDHDLLTRGVLLGAGLRQALATAGSVPLERAGRFALETVDAMLGNDVPHVPLFRRFPKSTPADTFAFYVDRVFALLLQQPEQPCVLCGEVGTVQPVAPCAHLVCGACFDGSDFSACPICHKRIDLDSPFLTVKPSAGTKPNGSVGALPQRARLFGLGTDFDTAVREVLTGLLTAAIPPRPQDAADLAVLQAHVGHDDLGWLPDSIPVRVTRAQVLGTMLADPTATDRALEILPQHLDTATDVLRTLAVAHGGPADLSEPPQRRSSLPRRVRRAILALLETFPFPNLAEDVQRHPVAWKHMAEGLHPFENHKRFPNTALAFAILRETDVSADDALARALFATAASYPEFVETDGVRLRFRTWTARVEQAFASGALDAAIAALAERPGELARRLNHTATRVADGDPHLLDSLVKALTSTLSRVSPGVLLSALGTLRGRAAQGRSRVYFPATGPVRMWIEPDARGPLPTAVVDALCGVLTDELDRRATQVAAAEQVVLDEGLADLKVPFLQKSASESLVDLPRGSVQRLPEGKTLRLFLHWMDPANEAVDLDLSLAFYDRGWKLIHRCDYTQLRTRNNAAVHSGDLTSAPAPLGASEFVDLDIAELQQLGVAYAVAMVFSYSGHAFESLEEAFAGVMLRDEDATGHFDARTVEQRFDLHGTSRAAMPMIVDLAAGTMRWLDLSGVAGGAGANVLNQQARLATQAAALEELFGSERRVSLWELGCRQAAGTTDDVVVRRRDGDLRAYRRRVAGGESRSEFAARLLAIGSDDGVGTLRTEGAARFLLTNADLAVPDGSEVYALYPGLLDAARVRLLDAAALVSAFAPSL